MSILRKPTRPDNETLNNPPEAVILRGRLQVIVGTAELAAVQLTLMAEAAMPGSATRETLLRLAERLRDAVEAATGQPWEPRPVEHDG